MNRIELNGIWKLCGKPQEEKNAPLINLDAKVPGCVLLDLSQQGYLPKDLYMGENLKTAEQYEDYEWWYERSFCVEQVEDRAYLVFEGVDCLCRYYLNGKLIGESKNAFISHEFCVDGVLKLGENTLTVHITSPVIEAHRQSYTAAAMLTWGNAPVETALRRPPHSYGWDIMPRAITTGIWKDVRLEFREKIRFSQLFPWVKKDSCRLLYEMDCAWKDYKDIEIEADGSCGDSTFYTRLPITTGKAGSISLPISNPKLWWPYGYGEANVYDGTARIYSEGRLVCEESFSFGLRSVELDRTDGTDGNNGRFRFIINGVEIMCKGSNWVPLDVFHCRDHQRLDRALALVKDSGCNILRCWGGNVYEDHVFFDFCDRNGIMVWQDFAMACRVYPQTESFRRILEEEITFIVKKLRNHPSLILWSGDNEIDQVYTRFGDPSANRITREWIPRILEEHDFSRPYLPSSPYLSSEVYKSKGALSPSEDHLWGPRDYFKSSYYKESKAHFVSEIGYHGCPSMESIKKFISPEHLWPYHKNREWNFHSTDQNNNDHRVILMEKQVRQLFGDVPRDPETYILASQISQAEAKKYFIERMRVGRPKKSGVIWWNLLDGWPQLSDAVVDYYFEKKLAYTYIKRSQAPFILAFGEMKSWHLPLFACNDTLEAKNGSFCVKDAENEALLLEGKFEASANTATKISALPMNYSDQKMLLIEWECDGEKGFNHYYCGFPPLNLDQYVMLAKKHLF